MPRTTRLPSGDLDTLSGLVGVDNSGQQTTVEYGAVQLGEFYASTGFADAAKTTFLFTFSRFMNRTSGDLSIENTNDNTFTPTTSTVDIIVSDVDRNGVNIKSQFQFIDGAQVKIGPIGRATEFIVGTVTSVANFGTDPTTETKITLTNPLDLVNTGTRFLDGDVMYISSLSGAGSGGQNNQNAFSNIAVSGQPTIEADQTSDTLNVAGVGISLTTNATNDTLTISTDHPHTNTFNGRIANFNRIATGIQQQIFDIIISHSAGFTYTINSVKVPTGWTATINTGADPDNFDLTIPASAVAGTFGVEVNYTSTETSTSTMHTDVLDFDVILAAPPTPYYTLSQVGAITGAQTLTSSPWVEVNQNVVTGTQVVFVRPSGVSSGSTYHGGIGIRTSGDGSVNIDTEASFDEGTSVPDVLTSNITPTGYTVYTFPLHLPRTTITITTF
ncbi:MAG: hypothetical protein MPJ25_00985 [Pirellulales bacterium]|nr:hypothetical protein [Pirellulales bacterium]